MAVAPAIDDGRSVPPLYLDHAATTPVWPDAVSAMAPWWGHAGNPHAVQHAGGLAARRALREAQRAVAGLVGAPASGVIFTGSATEANHLALIGTAAFLPQASEILIGAGDHACVQAAADMVADRGRPVARIPLDRDGLPDVAWLTDRLAGGRVGLVSLMAVHNEIGAMPDLESLGGLIRKAGSVFHVDAAQAPWRVDLDMGQIDLLTLSAHKIGGPPGIGALVRGTGGPRIAAIMPGGGQQDGLRGGTVPVPLAVGFAAAAGRIADDRTALRSRLAAVETAFLSGLAGRALLNGPPVGSPRRAAGLLSLSLPEGVTAEAAMAAFPDVAMASGAACGGESGRPSRTLTALGLSPDAAARTLRLSFAPDSDTEACRTFGAALGTWIERSGGRFRAPGSGQTGEVGLEPRQGAASRSPDRRTLV